MTYMHCRKRKKTVEQIVVLKGKLRVIDRPSIPYLWMVRLGKRMPNFFCIMVEQTEREGQLRRGK